MICAIKAQAIASGKVSKLNIAHRNTDAAGQLEDIRNLISAKVDAIVVNPVDPAGINAALQEATKAGIVVVAVDQAVTEPSGPRGWGMPLPSIGELSGSQTMISVSGRCALSTRATPLSVPPVPKPVTK